MTVGLCAQERGVGDTVGAEDRVLLPVVYGALELCGLIGTGRGGHGAAQYNWWSTLIEGL